MKRFTKNFIFNFSALKKTNYNLGTIGRNQIKRQDVVRKIKFEFSK